MYVCMYIYICYIIFLQIQGDIFKPQCLLDINSFFSSNSSMNTIHCTGDIKRNSKMKSSIYHSENNIQI